MTLLATPFARRVGIEVPIVCGAMYPCSNPELVGAVSAAGGVGVLQPLTLTYVHGLDFREGVRRILHLAGGKPVGMNALIEQSSRVYHKRMVRWVETALEEGVRFFVTSLGNPRWVVDAVARAGGTVYHDVTERKWALKALDGGVHGLIGVNERAGGHAGAKTARQLLDELGDLGVPVLCAGGIGDAPDFAAALAMGYAGVQMGTRFIATDECDAHPAYKRAIVDAGADDIVLTERVTGVPLAVIRTPLVDRVGTKAGPLGRWLLRGRRTKRWARAWYAVRSARRLKRANVSGDTSRDYWQAGKSVAGVRSIEPAGRIVRRFAAHLPVSAISTRQS
ncbi:MAG: nitronate monooxygenase family protein [Gemmatimonadota bacterium]